MTKEEIEAIAKRASQPRASSWQFWLNLLKGKPKPKPGDGVFTAQDLLKYKPHIALVCEPLFGRLVQFKPNEPKLLVALSLEERISIFTEALDIVHAFGQVDDLMRLAVFRRQVTNMGGLEVIDRPLYNFVIKHFDRITDAQLSDLPLRMPPLSDIRRELMRLSTIRVERLAAE